MPLGLFIFLAIVALLTALGVIVQRSPLHCLLALAVNLVDIGVIFIGLGAVTIGFLQIIIYVGAIMVLFLFVIWLLNLQTEPGLGGHLALKFFGCIGAAVLAAELAMVFSRAQPVTKLVSIPGDYGSIVSLGRMLFSDYLIAFEITSVLLLAAIVGAIGLARRMPSSQTASRGQRTRSAPSSRPHEDAPRRAREVGL
jgi:NADH-quinone oxidoreductase subunit J